MNKRSSLLLASFLLALFVASLLNAAESPAARALAMTGVKRETPSAVYPLDVGTFDACTPIPLTPPATIQGNLSALSCYDSVINSYEDIYNLNGVAGQTVTIDYSSTAFDVFLYMEGVNVDLISFLPGVSRQRIVYTFPQTRTYKLETETLYGPGNSQSHSGPYTLVVTTSGGGSSSCTNTATTICLSGGRFAVSATWATNTASGQASAAGLTSDTGYFTFFSQTNVEVVVKVLNACTLNSRYWVFAGGLTNVNVVLTVRDTKTGAVRTYTNPANTAFQPIQDTNALATCP